MEGLIAAAVAAFLFLLLLWIFLPFLIYGTNKRLDALLAQSKAINLHLIEIRDAVHPEVNKETGLPPIRAER